MVTKGMTVIWPEMSLVSLVDPIVALVPSASSWTATKGITDILLFDSDVTIIIVIIINVTIRLVPLITGSRLCSSGHSSMQRRQIAHHLLILIDLIGVNGLSMLTKIIETRELFSTVASEGAFTGVFPVWAVWCKVHCL